MVYVRAWLAGWQATGVIGVPDPDAQRLAFVERAAGVYACEICDATPCECRLCGDDDADYERAAGK